MKRITIIPLVLTLAIGLATLASAPARAALPPRFGGTLRVPVPDRVAKLDPAMGTSDFEFMALGCIYETLVEPGPGGSLRPVLLDTMPISSDDSTKYYFKLIDGIKFHDGSPLDAADVLHSFKQLVKHKHSAYSWIFSDVLGADEFRAGKSRTIEGFIIKDSLRFEIVLKRAVPDFAKYLSFPAAGIMPSADRHFEPPIGTGPFKYFEKTPRGDLILKANKDHHGGRPYLDGIEFKLIRGERDRMISFKRGELDTCDVPMGGLSKEEASMFQPPLVSPIKRTFFLDLNPRYKALSLHEYEIAISRAIDRKSIVKAILNGAAAEVPAPSEEGDPEGLRAAAAEPAPVRTIEPDAADDSTKEPGVPDDSGEQLDAVALWYLEYVPELEQIAKQITGDLKKAGLSITAQDRTFPGLLQYSVDDAPAFILRSLPNLQNLPNTVREVLYNDAYRSRDAAIGLRLSVAMDDPAQERLLSIPVIELFLRRSSYLCRPDVLGIEFGSGGVPRFDNAFIRKRTTDLEQLDN